MIIEEIIKYNELFVANKGYEKYLTEFIQYKRTTLLIAAWYNLAQMSHDSLLRLLW